MEGDEMHATLARLGQRIREAEKELARLRTARDVIRDMISTPGEGVGSAPKPHKPPTITDQVVYAIETLGATTSADIVKHVHRELPGAAANSIRGILTYGKGKRFVRVGKKWDLKRNDVEPKEDPTEG